MIKNVALTPSDRRMLKELLTEEIDGLKDLINPRRIDSMKHEARLQRYERLYHKVSMLSADRT